MRRVNIVVTCDCCGSELTEDDEGSSTVRFIARGEERELDLCDDCLYGTFLQEARPVTNRRKRKPIKEEFECDVCHKTFETQRGLRQHATKKHRD